MSRQFISPQRLFTIIKPSYRCRPRSRYFCLYPFIPNKLYQQCLRPSYCSFVQHQPLLVESNFFSYQNRQFSTQVNDENLSKVTSATPPKKIANKNLSIVSQPPFGIRVALVGASVGLCTPLFIVSSIIVGWFKYLPQSLLGRLLKYSIGALIGGGIVTLSYRWLIPFLYAHGDLVLPFALANTVASAFWYALFEYKWGIEGMAGIRRLPAILRMLSVKRVPVGGVLVGLATTITAPFLWPSMINLCWSEELKQLFLGKAMDSWFLIDLYMPALPVFIFVGFLAGISLHGVLSPVLLGKIAGGTKSWTKTSLPLLIAILGFSLFYFGFSVKSSDDLFWEERIDVKNGKRYSYNIRTGKRKEGREASANSMATHALGGMVHLLRRPLGLIWDSYLQAPDPIPQEVVHEEIIWKSGKDVAINDILMHSQVFKLIDLLARMIYLEQKEKTENINLNDHKEALQKYANENYKIELSFLADHMMKRVCISRWLAIAKLDKAKYTSAQIQQVEILFNQQQTRIKNKYPPSNNETDDVLDCLLKNYDSFSKEIEENLGNIFTCEEIERLIGEEKSTQKREKRSVILGTIWKVCKVVTVIAAVSGCGYCYFDGNNSNNSPR